MPDAQYLEGTKGKECRAMKRQLWLGGALAALLWATPVNAAGGGVIVRTTLGLQGLQALCLANSCTVVPTALDGALGQLFLVTTLLDPATLASTLSALPGIVHAEVDQLLNLVNLTNLVPSPIPSTLLQDRSSVPYPANSTTTAWNSYVNQPAASTRLRLHAEPARWFRAERCFFFAVSIRFVSASPLPDLLASEGESVHGGSAGPVHGGSARWKPVRGIWTRHDGDGRHPPSGSDRATLALEGVSFGWDRFALRHSARDLLRRTVHAEQGQRDQHELRHHDSIDGTAESPRLREPERRDLRGIGGKRREGRNCISRGVTNRCDGRGINHQSGHALVVLQLWKRHRVGGGSWRSDCEYVPVQHVCGGMGDLVQRAVCVGRGCVAAQPKCRH
jgi:hypothetical protein